MTETFTANIPKKHLKAHKIFIIYCYLFTSKGLILGEEFDALRMCMWIARRYINLSKFFNSFENHFLTRIIQASHYMNSPTPNSASKTLFAHTTHSLPLISQHLWWWRKFFIAFFLNFPPSFLISVSPCVCMSVPLWLVRRLTQKK